MTGAASISVRVTDLCFGYGARPVLQHASFQAEGGEFLALLGPNGAGKSTLLDLLAGLRAPGSGSYQLAGREHAEWTPRELAQRISHLPQAVRADLPFTAQQLVAMGRYPHTDGWFESGEDHRLMEQSMRRTRCWADRDRAFSTLSGGERQRVLLAACLAQDAAVMLLDEPSTFLDIEQQLLCFGLLQEEARRGKLCIAVTHDLNLALTHCTRLLVLAEGSLRHDLTAARAQAETEWLRTFSPRLELGKSPAGTPWVWYR